MPLIRKSDVDARRIMIGRKIELNLEEITSARTRLVARRLVTALRRNFRRSLAAPPATELLGKVIVEDSPHSLKAAIAAAHDALEYEIMSLGCDKEEFELCIKPSRFEYLDDNEHCTVGYLLKVSLLYRVPTAMQLLAMSD